MPLRKAMVVGLAILTGLGGARPAAAEARSPRMLAVRPVLEPATADRPARIARTEEGLLRMSEIPEGHPDRVRLERLAATAPVARMAALVGKARNLGGRARALEPIPVCLTEDLGPVGPRSVAFSSLWIEAPQGEGLSRGYATKGYVLVAPFELERGGASLEQMDRAGMLPAVLVHELFHMAMSTVYGLDYLKLQAQANPFTRHDSPVESDSSTALIEGLAEGAELSLEKRFPGQVYGATDPALPEAVRSYAADCRTRRFARADRNRYVFEADGRVRDGVVDPARDQLITEGVVAGVVADALFALDRPGDDGLDLLLDVLAARRPRTAGQLLRALTAAAGERARAVERTVLEATHYALADRDAQVRYRDAYLAKKAFVQGRAERAAWLSARAAYDAYKAEVRARIEAGRSAYAAIPEAYWVQTASGIKADLNEADSGVLAERLGAFAKDLGVDPALLASKVAVAREARAGFFDAGEALQGELVERLGPARERAVEAEEARLDKAARKLLEAARGQAFGGPAPCFAGPVFRSVATEELP